MLCVVEVESCLVALLYCSESTLLSEPAVSSEGVGASPSSATTEDTLYIPHVPYIQTGKVTGRQNLCFIFLYLQHLLSNIHLTLMLIVQTVQFQVNFEDKSMNYNVP